MPIKCLIKEALGTFVLKPGTPGAAGGPLGPPPPTPGTGWEMRVISSVDYSTLLCWVPQRLWNSNTFSVMLNSQSEGTQGSGTAVLAMDDPWWKTTTVTDSAGTHPAHYILDGEHLWQVWQDGVLRFDWLGETVTEQLVQTGEQRLVTVTGPDTSAVLDWASAMPAGFPDSIVYKTDALVDGFYEVDVNGNYVIDTGLWNASSGPVSINPAGSVQLNGTSGGTVLGSTAWDLTQSVFSAQVAPIVSPDALNKVLNGSQATQMYLEDTSGSGYYVMMALSGTSFYAQYKGPNGTLTHTIASAAQYATVQSSTSIYGSWQISEANGVFNFWTSADGQTWTKVWSITAEWQPTSVGVYFAAAYNGSGEYATVTSVNSFLIVTSLGGIVYLNTPVISTWLQTLAAAKARGTIPWVGTKATTAHDSYGSPWTDSVSVQLQNGTQLGSLLQGQAATVDADWMMTPGFELLIGIPAPVTPNQTNVTLGYDRSAYVRFYEAGGQTAKQRQRARNQIANLVAAINTDGRTIVASDATSIAEWKQREAWVQAAAQVTELDLEVVAEAAAEANADEVLTWTMQITPNQPGRTVFRDFNVGDWVGLERPDWSAVDAVRVVGITVSIDSDGNETHELVLVSYLQWLEQRLTFIQTKMGGGFVASAGTTAVADNANASSNIAPTVFTETYGYLGTSGGTGAPMVYNSLTGQWVPAGSTDPVSGEVVSLGIGGPGGATVVGPGGVAVGAAAGSPGPLNPNYAFPAGSGSGWAAQNGTVTVVAAGTAPPGCPAPYAAFLTPTGPPANVYLTTQVAAGVPTVSGLVPGTAYGVTAYVYLSAQSDMRITSRVDWYSAHGQFLGTVSVPGTIVPGSWQQLTLGVTAPAGATQCNLFIGPYTAVVGNSLCVTDFFIYNSAFGTSGASTGGTTVVGPGGTSVIDGSGTTRIISGAQGDGSVTTRSYNSPPPLAPDPPITSSTLLGVNVAWDGLLGGTTYGSGSPPMLDFLHVQVHASTVSTFTPSSATLQAVLVRPGNVTITQLNAGTAYYILLVAENDAGVLSASSILTVATPGSVAQNIPAGSIGQGQLSFTVANITFSSTAPASPAAGNLWYDGSNGNQLKEWNGTVWVPYQYGTAAIADLSITAAQIAAGTITAAQIAAGTITAGQIAAGSISANSLAVGSLVNQNVYFAGGDTTGWIGAGGVLTGTVTPPAGLFPAAAVLTTDGSTTGPGILTAPSAQFPVSAGQFYLATAWTFTAQTAVVLGIIWYNASGGVISAGTVTSTVTPSAWTQVSALEQAPVNAVAGALVCGLPSIPPNATILYVEELRLYSPVNGGIIEAGTIEGASIVAGSITADRLVANIVVAGIVNATTITAATFSGSVFMGTNWLENPAGGFYYGGSPASGNLTISIAPTGGSDAHGNPYPDGVCVIGGTLVTQAKIQLSALSFDPTLNLFTGAGSEAIPGELVTHTVNPAGAAEYMETIFKGPGSTYDGAQATVTLASTTANGATAAFGTLGIGTTVGADWSSSGMRMGSLHVASGYGNGQLVTDSDASVGGNLSAAGNCTVTGIVSSGQVLKLNNGMSQGATTIVTASSKFGIGTFDTGVGITAASIHTGGIGQFDAGVQVDSTLVIDGSGHLNTGVFASGVGISAASIHTSGIGQFDGGVTTAGLDVTGAAATGALTVTGGVSASANMSCANLSCSSLTLNGVGVTAVGTVGGFPMNTSIAWGPSVATIINNLAAAVAAALT